MTQNRIGGSSASQKQLMHIMLMTGRNARLLQSERILFEPTAIITYNEH